MFFLVLLVTLATSQVNITTQTLWELVCNYTDSRLCSVALDFLSASFDGHTTQRCITPEAYIIPCNETTNITSNNACNKTQERQWLTEFYNSTNGDNWKINDGWLDDSIDYCEWYVISQF